MGLAFKHLFFLNHIVTLRMFRSTIRNSVTTLFDVLPVVTLSVSILLIMVFALNFFSFLIQ